MLQCFKTAGMRCVGVEPSTNVADVARERGLDVVNAFFDRQAAAAIREQYGAAAAIVAANAICHVADFHALAAGVRDLLGDEGWFVFEDPYLGDMIEQHAYDQIYDEHVFMWSATSVAGAITPHGMELIDVQPQRTHGGSMRYYCAIAGRKQPSPAVHALIARERERGLTAPVTFDRFRSACEHARRDVRELLTSLHGDGKRVAGYAATSKSTTVLNYCGIDRSLIQFIVDTTKIKQGTVTPGTHIPVRPTEEFRTARPDYAVLFAWNHAREIVAKEKAFTDAGGRWISFVPKVVILD
jgi:methylation protein EvaC